MAPGEEIDADSNMLLLHQDPSGFARLSPEQMQAAVEKYMAWGQKLRQAGYLTASNKLTDEPGRVVRSHDGQLRVTDGPYSETKEVLGGYFTDRGRRLRSGRRTAARLPAPRVSAARSRSARST